MVNFISGYSGLTATFDWLSIVFDNVYFELGTFSPLNKYSENWYNDLLHLLGSSRKITQYNFIFGRHGFRYRIIVDEGIEMLFEGPKSTNDRDTSMLLITGKGCKIINQLNNWFSLFSFCLKYMLKVTRLDIAIDDRIGKYYTIYDLYEDVINNENYTSNWKKRPVFTGSIEDGKYKGLTIKFGAPTSGTNLVVYDKNSEQLVKDIGYVPETNYWVRWEMRFKDEMARRVMEVFCARTVDMNDNKSFYTYISSLLFMLLKIRIPSNDNFHKDRWKINQKYEEFLGLIEEVEEITRYSTNSTLLVKKSWLERSVFKSLSMMMLSMTKEDFEIWFLNQIFNAFENYDREDIVIVRNHFLNDHEYGDIKIYEEIENNIVNKKKTIELDIIKKIT